MTIRSLACVLLSAAVLSGCERDAPASPDVMQADATVRSCVEEFRAALAALAQEHPELAGAKAFDASYLGYTFLNNATSPRTYIVLAVELGDLDDQMAVPVAGYDELPNVSALTSLHIECDDPVLREKVEALYHYFRASLAKRLTLRIDG